MFLDTRHDIDIEPADDSLHGPAVDDDGPLEGCHSFIANIGTNCHRPAIERYFFKITFVAMLTIQYG